MTTEQNRTLKRPAERLADPPGAGLPPGVNDPQQIALAPEPAAQPAPGG